jgi:hypothetical protein
MIWSVLPWPHNRPVNIYNVRKCESRFDWPAQFSHFVRLFFICQPSFEFRSRILNFEVEFRIRVLNFEVEFWISKWSFEFRNRILNFEFYTDVVKLASLLTSSPCRAQPLFIMYVQCSNLFYIDWGPIKWVLWRPKVIQGSPRAMAIGSPETPGRA